VCVVHSLGGASVCVCSSCDEARQLSSLGGASVCVCSSFHSLGGASVCVCVARVMKPSS